jgi:hypothetical protein
LRRGPLAHAQDRQQQNPARLQLTWQSPAFSQTCIFPLGSCRTRTVPVAYRQSQQFFASRRRLAWIGAPQVRLLGINTRKAMHPLRSALTDGRRFFGRHQSNRIPACANNGSTMRSSSRITGPIRPRHHHPRTRDRIRPDASALWNETGNFIGTALAHMERGKTFSIILGRLSCAPKHRPGGVRDARRGLGDGAVSAAIRRTDAQGRWRLGTGRAAMAD